MRSDIEAAILGMYDSIERAREAQAAAGHSDQGARQGDHVWKAPGSDCSYHS